MLTILILAVLMTWGIGESILGLMWIVVALLGFLRRER